MTTWLICGGRDYDDAFHGFEALADIARQRGAPSMVVQGGTRGADLLALRWAQGRQIACATFRADWKQHGRAAGPIRNQRMLDEGKPDLVIAFPGGRGTADMVRRARRAGVEVIEVGKGDGS